MKTKNLLNFFIVSFATIMLLLFSKQLNANKYLTIYMDSIVVDDTMYVCDTYDSIKFIPVSNCNNFFFWRVEYYDGYNYYKGDTIYSDTLYLPTNFQGLVDYQGHNGVDYCGNYINIRPLVIIGNNKSASCGSLLELNGLSNFCGTGNLVYSWSPTTGLNDPSIPKPSLKVTGDMQYTITVNAPNGCIVSKNINVKLQPLNSPSICLVSVDTINKNIIYWEKPESISVDSFFIYKEINVTNVYQKIGATGYNEENKYIDSSSFPYIQSNKYKISLMDSCNFESDMSLAHKTIHLTINQGLNNSWNLIWEHYEGFEVSTYYIYRGTDNRNLQLIGTTAGSSTQYSDYTAPSGFVFYQIEVISPFQCDISEFKSTQITLNTSRSNIATNSQMGFEETNFQSNIFSIHPNPFNDRILIELESNNSKNGIIEITDFTGKRIKTLDLISSKIEINTSTLSNGFYIIRIKTDNDILTQKIVKK